MMFLAVFCGFLAENFREHKVERAREKLYIKNLYKDLQADTVIFNNYIKTATITLAGIDTLEYLMKKPGRDKHLSKIYFLARTTTMWYNSVFPNMRTFEEMKQGGQLRLIHNNNVANSISFYYNKLNLVIVQNNEISERITGYINEIGNIFSAETHFQIHKEGKEPASSGLKLVTNEPIAINRFPTIAQYVYGYFKSQYDYAQENREKAVSLMKLIKEEYNL
jgi:hypothetical protein